MSPHVEAAQFAVLFHERPDERRRAASSKAILDKHQPRIDAIARKWAEFAIGGKDFAHNDYANPDFLDAYLAYYFSTNVCKIQLVLLDLARQGLLSGELSLLDVGVGTGTTAVGVLDFLLAWGEACDLYGKGLPVTSLRLVGVDRSHASLQYAHKVVSAYGDALKSRMESRRVMRGAPRVDESDQPPDALGRVCEWARSAVWMQSDLELRPVEADIRPNLLVMSNVLSELHDLGLANADRMLRGLPNGAITIIIEPGDERKAQSLMRWRRALVNGTRGHEVQNGFVSLGPCGQEYDNCLPEQCEMCWSARRESFQQPALYRSFREACCRAIPGDDRRPFDDYENHLLSWSYAILAKHAPDSLLPPPDARTLVDGERIDAQISLRYIGSYRKKSQTGSITPVDNSPDGGTTAGPQSSWSEYLKVCAAGLGVTRVALERRPGFEVPRLRYGHVCQLSGATAKRLSDGIYALIPGTEDSIEPSLSERPEADIGFLAAYDRVARRAVDEIAYRLFGFPELFDFQHEILSRVLRGQSTLGIAATGGGKSECFILPAMLLPGVTVVISPLKALMADQYQQRISLRYGLQNLTTYINGDVEFRERQARLKRMVSFIT